MIPDHHKAIARHVAAGWGVRPRVETWSADGTPVRQAIAIAPDWPAPGVTAYSTVGLSDHGGYEVAAMALARRQSYIKAVFDVASVVVEGTRRASRWAVFEKAISHYYSPSEAAHLVLADVAPQGLALADLEMEPTTVRWLYAIPITSAEAVHLTAEGPSVLRAGLESANVDALLDLDRSTLPGVPPVEGWR